MDRPPEPAPPASTIPPRAEPRATGGPFGRFASASLVAAVATVAIAAACRVLAGSSHSMGPGYELSDFLWGLFGSPGAWVSTLLTAGLLGAATRSGGGVALGMMAPFAPAAAVEMAQNPSNHNLIPIEVIGWAVYAAILFVAATVGRLIRSRRAGTESAPVAPPDPDPLA